MEEIEITIEANGDVTVEGHGFSGPECEKFIDEIAAAVGTVTKKTRKPEYFRTRTTKRTVGT